MNNNSDDHPVAKPFNKYFDHTLLKPDASAEQMEALFAQAAEYDFASVCVNSSRVAMAREYMNEAAPGVKVAAVVGFPLGAMSTEAKEFETTQALMDGADEIDMVINIGVAKDGDWDYVLNEVMTLANICHDKKTASGQPAVLKVIIETCLLSDDEIVDACTAAMGGGADFVKTSTGFATPSNGRPSGATVHDIELMKSIIGDFIQIKASGGIRTLEDAKAMIKAGADRLGCSASVDIIKAYNEEISQ